jgi:hypothetical protein
MSAVATTRTDLRPTWLQSAGAVIGGMVFGYLLSLVWYLPLGMAGVIPLVEDTRTGHGWPWAVDDAWSLAANIGPLLLAGVCLALGIESFTVKWTGVQPQRLPLVIAAALLGWLPFGVGNSGLLGATGLVAFVGMVWVTREYSVRERTPWRWTRTRAWSVAATAVVLTAATVSFGLLHPFSVELDITQPQVKGDEVTFGLFVHEDGPLRGHVRAIEVPGQTVVRAEIESDAHFGSQYVRLTLAAAHGCVTAPIDELLVRGDVAGRNVTQSVHTSGTNRTPCG